MAKGTDAGCGWNSKRDGCRFCKLFILIQTGDHILSPLRSLTKMCNFSSESDMDRTEASDEDLDERIVT